jgi:hypothetical protein
MDGIYGTGTTARFLRLCLQARWRPEAMQDAQALAAQDDVAWDDLLGAARAGGVAPLLYHAVRGGGMLPPTLEDQLRIDYFANAKRNLLLFQELEDMLQALARQDVPVILLKGAALAEAVYGNVAVRPMGDVDLLVEETDVPTALRVVAGSGYEITPPRAYRCEVMGRKAGEHSALIEIHWNLFVPFYYQYAMPMDWFWATGLPLEVGEASTSMLGPEAQVLHLCGHLALHHGAAKDPRLLWLYDLAVVVARYEHSMDWDLLLSRAQAYDLVLPLQRLLPQLHAVWDTPIPPGVLERLADLEPSHTEKHIIQRLESAHGPAVQRLWEGLGDLPGWGPELRFAWRNLFPPASYMEQIYRVPHSLLLPLYYPYRWLLGLHGLLRSRR